MPPGKISLKKIHDFNRIQTHDFAIWLHCSTKIMCYEDTHWEPGPYSVYNICVLTDLTGQIWLTTEICFRMYWTGRTVLTNGKGANINGPQLDLHPHPSEVLWHISGSTGGCWKVPLFFFTWALPKSYIKLEPGLIFRRCSDLMVKACCTPDRAVRRFGSCILSGALINISPDVLVHMPVLTRSTLDQHAIDILLCCWPIVHR